MSKVPRQAVVPTGTWRSSQVAGSPFIASNAGVRGERSAAERVRCTPRLGGRPCVWC